MTETEEYLHDEFRFLAWNLQSSASWANSCASDLMKLGKQFHASRLAEIAALAERLQQEIEATAKEVLS